MHGSCSAVAVTAAIFHRRAALACPLVISCNRSTLSTHHGQFKVSTGEKGKERRGEEKGEWRGAERKGKERKWEDDRWEKSRRNRKYVWEK